MLTAVTIVSLVLAGVCAVFAFFALFRDREVQSDVKETAKELNNTAKAAVKTATSADPGVEGGLAANTQPQAAFAGAAEYLKALATFSDSLSKLRQGLVDLSASVAGFRRPVRAGRRGR